MTGSPHDDRTRVDDRRLSLTLIVVLLRLGGVLTILAFPMMLLPVGWMDAIHQSLGLGPLPRAPIVDYLARSIAALYGFHGVLLLIISRDPVGYRALVWYAAVMSMVFGLMVLAIDIHAGLPTLWIAAEGPPVAALGVLLACLNRAAGRRVASR